MFLVAMGHSLLLLIAALIPLLFTPTLAVELSRHSKGKHQALRAGSGAFTRAVAKHTQTQSHAHSLAHSASTLTGTLKDAMDAKNRELVRLGNTDGLATEKRYFKDAWKVSGHSPQRQPYVEYKPSKWIAGEDKVGVYLQNGICRIDAEESGFSTSQLSDWYMNILKPGKDPIYSIRTRKHVEHKSCGCAETRMYGWLGCKRYKKCSVKKVYGYAMDGFVQPVNAIGHKILTLVEKTCPESSTSQYVFQGYSRGGGIAHVLATLFYMEDLVSRSKMKLITWGSPRALSGATAKGMDRKFPQHRFRNGNDPVPKLPPVSLDFQHIGEYITLKVGSSNRVSHGHTNQPTISPWVLGKAFLNPIGSAASFADGIGDHTKYSEWFGTP